MITYRDSVLEKSYWKGNGLYQSEYDNFIDKLVPDMGSAPTKEGEMIRAASKLYYDYYNNGMCNNTSGAANFLADSSIYFKVEKELDKIYSVSNTGGYTGKNLQAELEAVVNAVIEYVISKDGNYEPNSVDMYDFQEATEYEEEEEEDDEYSYYDEEDEDYED